MCGGKVMVMRWCDCLVTDDLPAEFVWATNVEAWGLDK